MSPSNGTIKSFAAKKEGGPLEPFEYKARAIGDDDIEIKIDYCGVCASDLHQVNGGWKNSVYPMVPGHEIIGTCVAAGKSVSNIKVGQRVGLGAQCWACHDQGCPSCNNKLENLCSKAVYTYNSAYADGEQAQGGYAQYVRAQSQLCFVIPDKLDSITAAPLLCAGITTFAPIYRAQVKGKSVGVIGIGGLGHLALQWCKAFGARDIYAISHSDRKEAEAKKLGATHCVNTSSQESMAAANNKLDFILCTANAAGQDWGQYLGLLKPMAQFVLVAVPEEPLATNAWPLVSRQVSIGGSILGSVAEIEEMFKVAAENDVKAWTELLPLASCNTALERLHKGDVRYRFVLDVLNHKF